MFEKPGNLINTSGIDLTKTKGCFPPLITLPFIIEKGFAR